MKEAYDFLKSCGTYYLATAEGNQPRVRPFGTVLMFKDKLYIQTGKSKNVSKQMQANPKIEICAFDGKGQWIRVAATAVRDENLEVKQQMLEAYPNLKNMYKAEDANTEVLYLKDADVAIYSFGGTPRVITWK